MPAGSSPSSTTGISTFRPENKSAKTIRTYLEAAQALLAAAAAEQIREVADQVLGGAEGFAADGDPQVNAGKSVMPRTSRGRRCDGWDPPPGPGVGTAMPYSLLC
jgi:hypothetical protein